MKLYAVHTVAVLTTHKVYQNVHVQHKIFSRFYDTSACLFSDVFPLMNCCTVTRTQQVQHDPTTIQYKIVQYKSHMKTFLAVTLFQTDLTSILTLLFPQVAVSTPFNINMLAGISK